jgi:hypothetical protein
MDYQKILDVAEQKLGSEYIEVISNLKECISAGSTGGEITSMVGHYLKHLKYKNEKAYFVLEKDIKEHLLSCKENGLFIN